MDVIVFSRVDKTTVPDDQEELIVQDEKFPIFQIQKEEEKIACCIIDPVLHEAVQGNVMMAQQQNEYIKAFSFQVKDLKEQLAAFKDKNILQLIWWKLTWKWERNRAIKKYEKEKEKS